MEDRDELLQQLCTERGWTLAAHNRHGDGMIASALLESTQQFFWFRWDYREKRWDNYETWNK